MLPGQLSFIIHRYFMWKFYIMMVGLLLAAACRSTPETLIRVEVASVLEEDLKVSVITLDSVYSGVLDSMGRTVIHLPEGITPGYASFRYHGMTVPLYIENGKGFGIFLKVEDWIPEVRFTDVGARKSQYLNREALKGGYPDFKMGEEAFLNALATQEKALLAALDSMAFDTAFTSREKQRIHYLVYACLPRYPAYRIHQMEDKEYIPSTRFYKEQKQAIPEEEALLGMPEYQEALVNLVNAAGMQGLEQPDEWVYLENQFRFIKGNIGNVAIRDFLVDKLATRYVGKHATDHLNEIVRFYHAYVRSPEKRRKFDELCGRWLKLAAGQPSPGFRCPDINGKEICLADFRGRYVYIDIWATWCLPCRGELPHLEKLARQMKSRNISFISLSCDQDKDAWEKIVRKEKLGGIQLYGGKEDPFIQAYVVRSIPRFILIDPRGNIVNADMSRPSDPRTAVFLETITVNK